MVRKSYGMGTHSLNQRTWKIMILSHSILACIVVFLFSFVCLRAYADLEINSKWIYVYLAALLISSGVLIWLSAVLFGTVRGKIIPKRFILYFFFLSLIGFVFLVRACNTTHF